MWLVTAPGSDRFGQVRQKLVTVDAAHELRVGLRGFATRPQSRTERPTSYRVTNQLDVVQNVQSWYRTLHLGRKRASLLVWTLAGKFVRDRFATIPEHRFASAMATARPRVEQPVNF